MILNLWKSASDHSRLFCDVLWHSKNNLIVIMLAKSNLRFHCQVILILLAAATAKYHRWWYSDKLVLSKFVFKIIHVHRHSIFKWWERLYGDIRVCFKLLQSSLFSIFCINIFQFLQFVKDEYMLLMFIVISKWQWNGLCSVLWCYNVHRMRWADMINLNWVRAKFPENGQRMRVKSVWLSCYVNCLGLLLALIKEGRYFDTCIHSFYFCSWTENRKLDKFLLITLLKMWHGACPAGGGGGEMFPYIEYSGMCRWKGYGFQTI